MKHKQKKLRAGHYIYRGFKVECCGYIKGHMNWEAVDEYGCGFAHSHSLKTTKALIDWELDHLEFDLNKKKDKMKPTEKKYEYAIKMHDGAIFRNSSDMADVLNAVDCCNADGLIICRAVRRSVGEWEEVE